MRQELGNLGQWIAGFLLACAMLAAPAMAQAGGASAQVNVQVRVLSFFRVSAIVQPATLRLQQAHIERGYIDIDEGASLSMETNSHGPVTVSVAYDPSVVAQVTVRLLGSEVSVGISGASARVENRVRGRQEVRVGYRVHLRSDAKPGATAWPIALALTPSA